MLARIGYNEPVCLKESVPPEHDGLPADDFPQAEMRATQGHRIVERRSLHVLNNERLSRPQERIPHCCDQVRVLMPGVRRDYATAVPLTWRARMNEISGRGEAPQALAAVHLTETADP